MYDDRGLDIIRLQRNLRPIDNKHNDWILDYDREQIDRQFEIKKRPITAPTQKWRFSG